MDSNIDTTSEVLSDASSKFVLKAAVILPNAATLEQNHQWQHALKQLEALRKEADDILDDHEVLISFRSSELTHDYLKLIGEVKSIRNQILEHVSKCNYYLYATTQFHAPPSYEEATSTGSSNKGQDRDSTLSSMNLSYSELGAVLENLKAGTNAQSAQVVYSCEDVTLYFISSDGSVSVASSSNTLRIFEVEDGSLQSLPKYYLQIFIYVYPLLPGVSPCIRTEFGAVVLPSVEDDENTDSDVQSIGILVPREKEAEFIAYLENILQIKIVICDTKESGRTSVKISETITAGAECLSKFLIQSAQKAEELMNDNTPKLIEKINPCRQMRRMSPCLSSGIKIAKDVTSVTAGITGFVVSTVGAATYSLGQYLAPHLKEKGSQLLSSTTGTNRNSVDEKIDAVFNVTAGAVEGLTTVYQGLEQSACIFGRSLSNNTIRIVNHRYGRSAAEFTQDTFETVSNGIEIGTHLRFFKPTSILKTTAKGIVIPKTESPDSDTLKKNSTSEPEATSTREKPSSPIPSTSRRL